jgi:hypothetical protein
MEVDIEKLPKTKREKFLTGLSALMTEAFKKEFHYTDIKTYEDAVEAEPVSEEDKIHDNDPEWVVALKKLRHITKVINGPDFIVDWTNGNQKKWSPWFNLSSGFGFGASAYDCSYAHTAVGSRLCFESEAESDYVANQFIDLYEISIRQ